MSSSSRTPSWTAPSPGWCAAVVASLAILGLFGYAFWLQSHDLILYLAAVQEDHFVEWGTFFADLLAALAFAVAAVRHRQAGARLPWFLVGLSLFCLVVGLEEISWGQRLFGYLPPPYFLAHNFQQELNVHNLASQTLRNAAMYVVLLGYGVLLPLLSCWGAVRRWLATLAIVPPPVGLLPCFLVSCVTWNQYPLKYTGEWVELAMGLSFLFAALGILAAFRSTSSRLRPALENTVSFALVLALGVVVGAMSSRQRADDPASIAEAQREVAALQADVALLTTPCHGTGRLHHRLYSFQEIYPDCDLRHGHFAELVREGLPQDRAEYFVDPWNSPYWIFCLEMGKTWSALVYSFGPNRLRDSAGVALLGDDVGATAKPPRPSVTPPSTGASPPAAEVVNGDISREE